MIKEVIIITLLVVVAFAIISFVKKAISKTFEIIFKISIILIAAIVLLTGYGIFSFYSAGYLDDSEMLVFNKDELIGSFSIENGKIESNNLDNILNNTDKDKVINLIKNNEMEKLVNKSKFIVTDYSGFKDKIALCGDSNCSEPFKMISNKNNTNITFLPKNFGANFFELFIN